MKPFAAGALTALVATAAVVLFGVRWFGHRLELNGC